MFYNSIRYCKCVKKNEMDGKEGDIYSINTEKCKRFFEIDDQLNIYDKQDDFRFLR